MAFENVGFVGGGRIVSIILGGFARAGRIPQQVIVSEPNKKTAEKLHQQYPYIEITADNKSAASQEVVFIAIHPPIIKDVLTDIRPLLKTDAVVISLAPKITIAKLADMLGGLQNIARMIPNAPSIVGLGYNPITFAETMSDEKQSNLLKLLEPLGQCPIVEEQKLEAYAILTAMGPTYLWFQLYELCRLGESFGLSKQQALEGIAAMASGSATVMASSSLTAEEVMDLIPVKPLSDEEEKIKNLYRSKLEALYQKLSAAGK
jgi:pyrroline-5-carboxylate reductase